MWKPLERGRRYLAAAQIDLRLALTGKTDPTLPPFRLLVGGIGSGDFRRIGDELAAIVVEHGGVGPDSRVLDVGCGVGRVAMPLTRHLSASGTYDGFDVSRGAVRWCRRSIGRAHPNFRFRHLHVRSTMYSAFGRPASEVEFPYESASFDCVFAFSLFTHLTFAEVRRYLAESRRVLVPGGRLVATFFLLNERSTASLPSLPPELQFPVVEGATRLASRDDPAFAVAIEEHALLEILGEIGFERSAVYPGKWAGRETGVTFQDLVVATT